MSKNPKPQQGYSRREALQAVGKYSLALTGASVVALTAEEAAAQAACSRPNSPWWCNSTGNGNGNGNGNGGGRGNGRGNAFGLDKNSPDYDPQTFDTFN